ncbi:MAG TPA: ferritin-like domain-containing protein, partial [Polyangiaceae bacterium]|nr:ferritin-like domain-containing protein [Polyangiaceae bacterium]
GRCGHDGSRRVCIGKDPGGCPIPGRPFWVEGAMRVAPLSARDDWASAVAGAGPAGLSPAQRATLGAHWARLGQMEHASVAAFARFALQLLALGAPPALVGGAIAAQSDELEHARQCFGLASWLGGTPVGPGPLPIEGALEAVTLVAAVRLAVREGCVGETVAALEASEAYERAVEGPVRAVLGRVRVDEGRHAELAWRFVGWALETGSTLVREAAAEAFLDALLDLPTIPPGPANEAEEAAERALEAFGLLPERVRAELRRRALCDVIGPCAERLLNDHASVEAKLHEAMGYEPPPSSRSLST